MNLFDLLAEEEKELYIEKKEYKKNEIIFSEGLYCNYIGLVKEGKIIISTITYNDKEEIINIINKDDIFGNNLIFSSSPIFLGNIISYSKSLIYFISKNNLSILLQNNILFRNKFIEMLSNQVLKEKEINKLFIHKNIRDRILYYINSEQKKKGHVRIKSIADLARILSLPRPSVSREISKLIKENIIQFENKNIILK